MQLGFAQMRARRKRAVLVVCAAGCAVSLSFAAFASAAADGGSPIFDRARVEACLVKQKVLAASFSKAKLREELRPLPGLMGVITIVGGPVKGLPPRDQVATIDSGAVAFLETHAIAERDERELADVFIYFKGEPATTRDLHPRPPANALPSLEEVVGNVAVYWQYPRHHAAASTRLIAACLNYGRRAP